MLFGAKSSGQGSEDALLYTTVRVTLHTLALLLTESCSIKRRWLLSDKMSNSRTRANLLNRVLQGSRRCPLDK